MKKNRRSHVLIFICFLAVVALPGFLKDVQGQGEGKTEVEEKSGEAAASTHFALRDSWTLKFSALSHIV